MFLTLPLSLKVRVLCGGWAGGPSVSVISAETLTNVLDFKRDAGLWHGVLTVSAGRYDRTLGSVRAPRPAARVPRLTTPACPNEARLRRAHGCPLASRGGWAVRGPAPSVSVSRRAC